MRGHGCQHGCVPACKRRKGQAGFAPSFAHHDSPASGGAQGQESDIIIQAREIEKIRRLLEEIMAKHTGKDVQQVREDSERDRWMDAGEALEYGIIDQVFEKRPAPEKKD